MRMMMKVELDTDRASAAIQDGSLPHLMQATLERLQPEAAYFGPEAGVRTAFIVFDLQDLAAAADRRAALQQVRGQNPDVPSDEPGGPPAGTWAARVRLARAGTRRVGGRCAANEFIVGRRSVGLPDKLVSLLANTDRSGPRTRPSRPALDRRRLGLHHPDRRGAQPTNRLRRMETAARAGRHTGRPAPRCPAQG